MCVLEFTSCCLFQAPSLSLSFPIIIIVVVIGYSPPPCRTNEGEGELVIQVGILFGVLARDLSVQFETLEGSAIGEGTPLSVGHYV